MGEVTEIIFNNYRIGYCKSQVDLGDDWECQQCMAGWCCLWKAHIISVVTIYFLLTCIDIYITEKMFI